MTHRPRLVTLTGWLFIIVGAGGLLKDWLPLLTSQAGRHRADLASEGAAMLTLIWGVRLLAVVGGAGVLRGSNAARWLLAAWMVCHVALSATHSFEAVLLHVVIFAAIAYGLFFSGSAAYFSSRFPVDRRAEPPAGPAPEERRADA